MLHIVNKSPLTNGAFDSCLRVATGGDILLIEDAVYAATSGSAMEDKMREAMKRFTVHVLQPDLEARGMADRLLDGVSSVDYGGFVELVAQSKNCQSWL
ncbi:MAG: sulfurtransferase complex subunit TusB [Sideroxydans sp.]|nr:sulfurtransferase complex subunit TusB [Sideroxydans sp.]